MRYPISKFAILGFVLALASFIATFSFAADDWPTYRHDVRRSGVTDSQLPTASMQKIWSWQSSRAPAPAWPDAARWDAYAQLDGLRSMRDYDPVFHPVVVDSQLYLASNADDTLRSFSLRDGDLIWSFTADAPIRVAPHVHSGKVYFGADDGVVYCLVAAKGELVWKQQVSESNSSFFNDGRLVSFQPIRTGTLIDEHNSWLVVGTGLFPWRSSSLVALDLQTGSEAWRSDLGTGWTVEGPLLLAEEQIVSPQGRAPPQLFARANGKPLGQLKGGGGSFAVVTETDAVLHGPGNKQGWIVGANLEDREQVARYEGALSLVVKRNRAFVLDPSGLTAFIDDQPAWRATFEGGQELVLAANHLVVGGDGFVAVIHSDSGELMRHWAVDGRAIGLAIANQSLVVSTDLGETVVYGKSAESNSTGEAASSLIDYRVASVSGDQRPEEAASQPQPIKVAKRMSHHWHFHRNRAHPSSDAQLLDSAMENGKQLSLPASTDFIQLKSEHAWLLDGKVDAQVAADFRTASPPSKSLTALATIRLDRHQPWGGILSMSQDNGSYEKGWILGFRNDKFGFAINARDGKDALNWVTSPEPLELGRWYQVAATYDGERASLYVNGRLVASSTDQSGDIQYPDDAAFHAAAYKDKDEHFYSLGALNEVLLDHSAWPAEAVASYFTTRSNELTHVFEQVPSRIAQTSPTHLEPIEGVGTLKVVGPELQFIAPDQAIVSWTPVDDRDTELAVLSELQGLQIDVVPPQGRHAQSRRVSNLSRNHPVTFRIESQGDAATIHTASYQCDPNFNYSRTRPVVPPSLAPSEQTAASVTKLVDTAIGGIAIVLGQSAASEEIALALLSKTKFDVLLVVDKESLQASRQRLVKAGVYGRPLYVMSDDALDAIPDQTANVLWCQTKSHAGRLLSEHATLLEKLQPGGQLIGFEGMESLTTTSLESWQLGPSSNLGTDQLLSWYKPRNKGSSGWTHMYGDPDNTAFAGETLQGASRTDQLKVSWAGRPGPRYQSDRGNRKPSPLAAGGRLYLQGHHRLICLDAHNGTILWTWELPQLGRFNIPRDCSNWCCDEEAVYVAIGHECFVFDGKSGEQIAHLPVRESASESKTDWQWGYLVRTKDWLLGSSVKAGSSFTGYWGKEFWYDAKDGEHAKKVCSDDLFALNPHNGSRAWTYEGGLIVNPTIAIKDDQIVFLESRSSDLKQASARRLDGEEFWNSLYVVALNLDTGETAWEVPAKPMHGTSACYGVCTDDQYLLQTSKSGKFALYALDLSDGSMKWRGQYDWEADHHGKHLSRPAVVGGKIYLRPLTLDLASGNVLSEKFPVGHQCGTYTASADALFLRAGNLAMWDGKSQAATRWERVRPDCWISTIPAEGMLLSPEGGGGCSCGGWIETSIGFAPNLK